MEIRIRNKSGKRAIYSGQNKVISDNYISTFSMNNLKFMREEEEEESMRREGRGQEEGGKRAGGGRE